MTIDEAIAHVNIRVRAEPKVGICRRLVIQGDLDCEDAQAMLALREEVERMAAEITGLTQTMTLMSNKLDRVEAYLADDGNWRTGSAADNGHHPLLDSTRAEICALLRGES